MKESASIAHTFVRSFMEGLREGDMYFANHSIHVHVPAGKGGMGIEGGGCEGRSVWR